VIIKRLIGDILSIIHQADYQSRRRSIVMALDPVCNMEVDEATAQWTSEYKGTMYYFCAPGCKASFDEDPEKYLSGSGGHDHLEHDHHDHDHEHHHH
jgi:YHS domain-containing protein